MKLFKRLSVIAFIAGAAVVAAEVVPPGTADEIRERLQPFGSLCRAGEDCGQASAAAASGPMSGEAVYNQYCFACHMAGVGGAPVFGDAEAWSPRIAKGLDTLWQHTQNGFNAMPPKGTCMGCSDDELRGAMDYMISAAEG
ncbi:MAG: c-type cytochrome [Pseudomonadales bacterium]